MPCPWIVCSRLTLWRLDAFSNLANYKPKPEDGGVVAWLDHKKPKNHEMEFKIQVQSLKSKVASSQESATRVEL